MKLDEMVGEYLPYDDSTAMKLAKDLYRGSNGDINKAKAMLKYLMNQVESNIDKYASHMQTKRVG